MLFMLSRHFVICRSVAEVWLAVMVPCGVVNHRLFSTNSKGKMKQNSHQSNNIENLNLLKQTEEAKHFRSPVSRLTRGYNDVWWHNRNYYYNDTQWGLSNQNRRVAYIQTMAYLLDSSPRAFSIQTVTWVQSKTTCSHASGHSIITYSVCTFARDKQPSSSQHIVQPCNAGVMGSSRVDLFQMSCWIVTICREKL